MPHPVRRLLAASLRGSRTSYFQVWRRQPSKNCSLIHTMVVLIWSTVAGHWSGFCNLQVSSSVFHSSMSSQRKFLLVRLALSFTWGSPKSTYPNKYSTGDRALWRRLQRQSPLLVQHLCRTQLSRATGLPLRIFRCDPLCRPCLPLHQKKDSHYGLHSLVCGRKWLLRSSWNPASNRTQTVTN